MLCGICPYVVLGYHRHLVDKQKKCENSAWCKTVHRTEMPTVLKIFNTFWTQIGCIIISR